MTDARWPGWPFPSTDPRVIPQPSDQQEPKEPPVESGCPVCKGDGDLCAVCDKTEEQHG